MSLFLLITIPGKLNRSRVGVVAITLASHARGREFEPRIRYFSISFFLTVIINGSIIFEITITIITTTTTTIRAVTINSDDALYTHHSPTRNHFKSILPHSWITPLS